MANSVEIGEQYDQSLIMEKILGNSVFIAINNTEDGKYHSVIFTEEAFKSAVLAVFPELKRVD